MKCLGIALFLFSTLAFADGERRSQIEVGVGKSQAVVVEGLRRVSLADGRILRVRSVGEDRLILTGKKPGRTIVRAYGSADVESVFEVRVLSPAVEESLEGSETVKISVEFLELDSTYREALGIRWPDGLQFSAAGILRGGTNFMGLNYAVSVNSPMGVLQHLIREGRARILARPDLYVRLGEEAVFHSGGEMPVTTTTEDYGRFHRRVEWKEFGITVKVRPQSGDGVHISSDVSVVVSELNPARSIDGIPGLLKRHVNTKLDSIDGETMILSGLSREGNSEEKQRVPGLSSLPIVGPLAFTSRDQTDEKSEVLMAITFSLDSRHRKKERYQQRRKKIEEGSPG